MFFRQSNLTGTAAANYSRAVRILTMGGPVVWQLHANSALQNEEPLQFRVIGPNQPLSLGNVQFSSDRKVWSNLSSHAVVISAAEPDRVLSHGKVLEGITTVVPPASERVMYRAFPLVANAGNLLMQFGQTDTNRIQSVLDEQLILPEGRVPLFIQNGWTDTESLAWMACLLTEEIRISRRDEAANLVLTGSDGNGWQIVPLHGLSRQKKVPQLLLPPVDLADIGWSVPRTGPHVRLKGSAAPCKRLIAEFSLNCIDLKPRTSADTLLPLRLPAAMLKGKLAEWQWVVGMQESWSSDDRYRIELDVCRDPASLFEPVPPATLRPPEGILRGKVAKPSNKLPAWTLRCELIDFENTMAAVAMSTLYCGQNGQSGLHVVPEETSPLLIIWRGRLSEYPVALNSPRPAGQPASEPDVRKLGPLAAKFPKTRGVNVEFGDGLLTMFLSGDGANSGSAHIATRRDLELSTEKGDIRLARKDGRTLKVGISNVDVDPV